jgi:hypothetical protein
MAQEKITPTQILLPVLLLSVAVAGFLAFQTTLLFNDRAGLQAAHAAQDKPLADANKVKDQANGLAVGALRLANAGDKTGQAIIEQLKKNGVNVQENPNATGSAPAAPAAAAPEEPAPAPAP